MTDQSPGRCDSCGRQVPQRFPTLTGRRLCQSCSDRLNAGAAAVLLGGGAALEVGNAVAIEGWLPRVRKQLRKDVPDSGGGPATPR